MADRAKLRAMLEKAWAAPWVARTFEIDCPCPNGVHCGDLHTCEEVEAPEAYPASHEEPAGEGEGQCVVQIAVPGLESLARPNAEFIAAARNELPGLLDELDRAEGMARAIEAFLPVWAEIVDGYDGHDTDECPQDDTCDCETMNRIREAERGITASLAAYRSYRPGAGKERDR